MSDDTDPSGSDKVIEVDFGRRKGPKLVVPDPPLAPLPVTRAPGSDAELERALEGRDHEAWLDLLDIIELRLERPLDRAPFIAERLPRVEAELQRWPKAVVRPAAPAWIERHDEGDPLAARLLALTHAPGGYVLTRHFSLSGYDDPGNGSLLHESTQSLLGACADFLADAMASKGRETALVCVEFTMCVLRWGVAVAPMVDLCEHLTFVLGHASFTLASARRDRVRASRLLADVPSRGPGLPGMRLLPLPALASPEATARLDELEASVDDEGNASYPVLGLLEELHGSG